MEFVSASEVSEAIRQLLGNNCVTRITSNRDSLRYIYIESEAGFILARFILTSSDFTPMCANELSRCYSDIDSIKHMLIDNLKFLNRISSQYKFNLTIYSTLTIDSSGGLVVPKTLSGVYAWSKGYKIARCILEYLLANDKQSGWLFKVLPDNKLLLFSVKGLLRLDSIYYIVIGNKVYCPSLEEYYEYNSVIYNKVVSKLSISSTAL